MQTRSDIGKSRYQKMREKNQKMHLKMENKVYNWPKPNKKVSLWPNNDNL